MVVLKGSVVISVAESKSSPAGAAWATAGVSATTTASATAVRLARLNMVSPFSVRTVQFAVAVPVAAGRTVVAVEIASLSSGSASHDGYGSETVTRKFALPLAAPSGVKV